MAAQGDLGLFSLDNDPDVIEARKTYQAARAAVRRYPRGQKKKMEQALRKATHELLVIEGAAEKKLKEAGNGYKSRTKKEDPKAQGQGGFITRECGDDTPYRSASRRQ